MPNPQNRLRSDGIAVYVYRQQVVPVPSPAVSVVPTPPSAVSVLPLPSPTSPSIEFLQLLRSATTGEYQQSWQVVYGGIEPHETAVQAALRELREETALFPRKMFQIEYLEMFYFQHKDYVTVMPVFAAEVSAHAPLTLNHEHTASRWIPASQVPAQFMWRSQREAIALILETLHSPGPAHQLLTIDLANYRRS